MYFIIVNSVVRVYYIFYPLHKPICALRSAYSIPLKLYSMTISIIHVIIIVHCVYWGEIQLTPGCQWRSLSQRSTALLGHLGLPDTYKNSSWASWQLHRPNADRSCMPFHHEHRFWRRWGNLCGNAVVQSEGFHCLFWALDGQTGCMETPTRWTLWLQSHSEGWPVPCSLDPCSHTH